MTQPEVDLMLAMHEREDAKANARIDAMISNLERLKRERREAWAAHPDVFTPDGKLIPRT